MRIHQIASYFMKRHWKPLCFYFLGLAAIILIAIAVLLPSATQTAMSVAPSGEIDLEVTHAALQLYNDPSLIEGTSSYAYIIFIVSILIINRERKFLVSLSASRLEILTGSYLYLLALSLVVTIVGGFVVPMIDRFALWALGIQTRGGWTVGLALTGGNPLWWRTLVLSFVELVQYAGLYTLLGYVTLRWWKIILAISAAGIVGIIIVSTQLSNSKFAQILMDFAQRTFLWISNEVIPALERYAAETNLGIIALRNIGIGLGLTALSYPIMARMKVA